MAQLVTTIDEKIVVLYWPINNILVPLFCKRFMHALEEMATPYAENIKLLHCSTSVFYHYERSKSKNNNVGKRYQTLLHSVGRFLLTHQDKSTWAKWNCSISFRFEST